MSKPTNQPTRPPDNQPTDDPATDYARSVVSRETVAGPYVRAACERHLRDLETAAARGLAWDKAAANRVILYFAEELVIEREDAAGNSEVVPFFLEPAQCFIVGSLFGWKTAKGLRRFRRAYVEESKGNGKTPLAAGVGHYMLGEMGKIRAEVYSAATDHDQASILFRDAVAMRDRSPKLRQRLLTSGQNPVWQLTDMETGSFFKPISSEKRGKSGPRPFCALLDEIHEHADDSVIEFMRAGTKGNQNALILEITNSGYDKKTVCGREHDYTVKVVTGALENDAWFGFITALDEKDDPFTDESCWIKANPNLGVSIFPEYIREQVAEAKGMPSKESLVRRLHFSQWTDAAETWITAAIWKKCERIMSLNDYKGRKVWLGLDLAFTQDLTALALVFQKKKGGLAAFVEFWTPGETLAERAKRDGVEYPLWVRQGFLNATPGKVIKLESVADRLRQIDKQFEIVRLAYDQYRHKELADELADLGLDIPMIEHPQGFRRGRRLENILGDDGKPLENPLWMPKSLDDLETAIIEERLWANVNAVLRWNVSAAVIRPDPAGTGNRVFDKRKATGRIDGVVALAMAVGVASARFPDEGDFDEYLANPIRA